MKSANQLGLWLAVGVAAGTVIGFSTAHPAPGIALGIGFGVAIAGILGRQGRKPAEAASEPAGTAPAAKPVRHET